MSRVNLCCAQCNAQIGIFENEWLHMTDSYARSDHKGTHFGTEVGDKLVVVPTNAAAAGCQVAEVVCLDCMNVVGRQCKTAPSQAQEYLTGEYFYKLSRVHLKDTRTNEPVDFIFIDDKKKSLALRNGYPASRHHHHASVPVTQLPAVEGTPDEAPDPRDGVLALRRVVVQEAKLEKANNKIRSLEEELHYLKTEMEDLRRRVNRRDLASSSKRKHEDEAVQEWHKRPANGDQQPEHVNGTHRHHPSQNVVVAGGVDFSDEDQELPEIPEGLAVDGDEALTDQYPSPQQPGQGIYPVRSNEQSYPSSGPAGDVIMREAPRNGTVSSSRPSGITHEVNDNSVNQEDDSEDGGPAPLKLKKRKVLSDDQYRKRRMADGVMPQPPIPIVHPTPLGFIEEEEDSSLWGRDAPPPRRHTTSMNWRDHFEHETEAMLEDMAAGAGDIGGELTQWAPRLPTTTKRLFQELEVLGMEQWIHRDRRSAEYLSTIRMQRKRHKDMGRPRRLEYGRWWCIRESEITATDRANPDTIDNMEWRQVRAHQRAQKLALEEEFRLEISQEREMNPPKPKKSKAKQKVNKPDSNIDPQLQPAPSTTSVANSEAEKATEQDVTTFQITADASHRLPSPANVGPRLQTNLGQTESLGSNPMQIAQQQVSPGEKAIEAQPGSDNIENLGPPLQSSIGTAEDTQDHLLEAMDEDELTEGPVDMAAALPTYAAVKAPNRSSPRIVKGATSATSRAVGKGKPAMKKKVSTKASADEAGQQEVQTRSRPKKGKLAVSDAQELQKRDKLVEEAMEKEEMGA